jgi:hypothetical protein
MIKRRSLFGRVGMGKKTLAKAGAILRYRQTIRS